MRKGEGAKARRARLQGRKEYSCEACGDDVGMTTCGCCGGIFCRDCKIDHPCLDEEPKRRKR